MSEPQHNTHFSRPFDAEGTPPEEEVSRAKAADQLDTDPDEVPNKTGEEGGPQPPKKS